MTDLERPDARRNTRPLIEATPQQIEDAGAVIGRAALFDNRFGQADIGRAAVWAEALEPYKLSVSDQLNAVTAHYRAEPDRMIMPADVIRLGRAIRAERNQRESDEARKRREMMNDLRHGLTEGDPQLGQLTVGGADGNPVPGAYEVNGAVDRGCPQCGAAPMHPCTNRINGLPRKLPCLARLTGKRPKDERRAEARQELSRPNTHR